MSKREKKVKGSKSSSKLTTDEESALAKQLEEAVLNPRSVTGESIPFLPAPVSPFLRGYVGGSFKSIVINLSCISKNFIFMRFCSRFELESGWRPQHAALAAALSRVAGFVLPAPPIPVFVVLTDARCCTIVYLCCALHHVESILSDPGLRTYSRTPPLAGVLTSHPEARDIHIEQVCSMDVVCPCAECAT